MDTAIVAVFGTLAGALLTGTLAYLTQRAQRQAAERAARRDAGLAAVTELVAALADHRSAMWRREELRLQGEDWSAARADSRTTRSAITGPELRVRLLLPALAPAAQTAVDAVYALRNVDTEEDLAAARERAIIAADVVVTTAADALAA